MIVGIGGGVPSADADLRLGDVVVNQPEKGHGGVLQYDFGKTMLGKTELTGFLTHPLRILLSAVTKVQANHNSGESKLSVHTSILSKLPMFARDKVGEDVLFGVAIPSVKFAEKPNTTIASVAVEHEDHNWAIRRDF